MRSLDEREMRDRHGNPTVGVGIRYGDRQMTDQRVSARRPKPGLARRLTWPALLLLVCGAVYLMATASTGPVDPTALAPKATRATVVTNASLIVFREGLEAVLIFAAITASLVGANAAKRRPIAAGAGVAFAASVATWFAVQALLSVASPLGARLEAITGFVAIVVLLIILNWFVHKMYWSEWIGRFHRQRRRLAGREGAAAALGLVALGFTSVYREGFEVVLFLQNLELQRGSGTVLEGVVIGLLATALVGVVLFKVQRKLPYRKMLITTAVLVSFVLVVMVGGTARTFVDLGWLPNAPTPFAVPGWMGAWFEIYGQWWTLAAQALAALFVAGSYFLAEELKERGPRRRGQRAASRAMAPPQHDQNRPGNLGEA